MKTGLQPASKAAYDLLHQGSIAFAKMSQVGLRIDMPYLKQAIIDVKGRIKALEEKIKTTREYKTWSRIFGDKLKWEAPSQIGRVIFDELGYKRNPFMRERIEEGGFKERNTAAAFEHLMKRVPFLQDYFEARRLRKALSTNLHGISREVVDGRIHPNFYLHTVESYRSSSGDPNWQNVPTRNKDISKIVRSSVIPDDEDYEFLEADYGTQEVRIAQCYNKDEKLLHDILHGDMHRDRAYELFLLSPQEMGNPKQGDGKKIRQESKNKFVFAEFYGDYFCNIAPKLWDSISMEDLKTVQGVSLYDHLRSKGITSLGDCDPDQEAEEGTFEYLVKQVEKKMWQEVYTTYNQWKKDWWDLYQRQGGVNTLTGFRMEGVFRRNQILCDGIQGSSFHCLLWSLIQLQREIIRRKMKSRIVVQVHDSMLIHAHKKERDDLIPLIYQIAVKDVAKAWKWITCPLALEFEIAESSWWAKKGLEVKL